MPGARKRGAAKGAKQARARAKNAAPPAIDRVRPEGDDLLRTIGRGVVSPVLHDPARRAAMGLPAEEDKPGRYMVELNVNYKGGLAEAERELGARWNDLFEDFADVPPKPISISTSYLSARLSVEQWRHLVADDASRAGD